MDRDGTNDWAGAGRIVGTVWSVTEVGATAVRQSGTYHWPQFDSAVSNRVRLSPVATDGLSSWSVADGFPKLTRVHYAGGGVLDSPVAKTMRMNQEISNRDHQEHREGRDDPCHVADAKEKLNHGFPGSHG